MNYELAKQLKDAGYPQETEFYFAPKLTRFNGANDHNWDGESMTRMLGSYEGLLKVACPSLSELIEKCGVKMNKLTHNEMNNDTILWTAVNFEGSIMGNGSTPEEAVAELWLALNKK